MSVFYQDTQISASFIGHLKGTADNAISASYVNPYVGQVRLNGGKLQSWNGKAWTQVPVSALTP